MSKIKRYFNVKSSTFYFHMNWKIWADFKFCIVPLNNCLADVLRTSLGGPMIWSQGRPATGSHRHHIDVPIKGFEIFALPLKYRNRYVIYIIIVAKIQFYH